MRGILLLLVIAAGCGKTSLDGEADAQDSLGDHDGAEVSCGDCDDRDPCTVDTCVEGTCVNTPMDCDDRNPCTVETCVEGTCVNTPVDLDGDGHVPTLVDGVECGDDCDDSDPDVHPGAFEVCSDGVDQDCDGMVDERLNPYGEVRITEAEGDSILPNMVWTGSEFGIVWYDERIEACDTLFTRVSPIGDKLIEDVIIASIPCRYHTSLSPSIVWTGSEFAAAWHEPGSDAGVSFSRMNASGHLVDHVENLATDAGPLSGQVAMAWTGSEFGLVHAWGDVCFERLSPEGYFVGDTVVIETSAGQPSIAWTGSLFGVVWNQWGTEMAILDPLGTRLVDWWRREESPDVWHPDIVASNIGFGVASEDGPWFEFWSTDSQGLEIGSFHTWRMAGDRMTARPSVCWTGSEFGLAWQGKEYDMELSYLEIYMSLVSAEGDTLGEEYRISFHDGYSEEPVVEWTGSELGVAWQDHRDGDFEIYFARVAICP
jgi:hypothetical protein